MIAADPGAAVTDLQLRDLVVAQVEAGRIAWDPEGIYFVFTGPQVLVHGGKRGGGTSCNQVCGYHHFFNAPLRGHGSQAVKYAAIPHGDCPDGCSVRGLSVNGPALDQMTVTLSHELAEAITDPMLDAWTTHRGANEVGDLCDGGAAVSWGGEQFAVQDVWSNADRHCSSAR